MPAKTEFYVQPELAAAHDMREARRSEWGRASTATSARPASQVRGRGGSSTLRSARGSACENNPSMGTGTNGRRSPRLGGVTGCTTNSRSMYPYSGARGAVLGDITNVASSRSSQIDKAKPLKRQSSYSSFQPPSLVVPTDSTLTGNDVPVPDACVTVTREVQRDSLADRAPLSQRDIVLPERSIAGPGQKDSVLPVRRPSGAKDMQTLAAQSDDAQGLSEYSTDINHKLFQDETSYLPDPDLMDNQTDITGKMRTILIDWLIEVHMKYRLRPETLHLTVNLIDRYLTKRTVMRKRLQLVGVVAMFIASKFEEIQPPELHDWVYITDNAYTNDNILVMECCMLNTLNFQIVVPTAAHFFESLERANGCDAVHRRIAQYLLELGLLDVRMLQFIPSQQVSAALMLSNQLLRRSPAWPESMVQESRLTEQVLQPCVDILRQLLEADQANSGGQLAAVHKKFAVPQRHSVSKMRF